MLVEKENDTPSNGVAEEEEVRRHPKRKCTKRTEQLMKSVGDAPISNLMCSLWLHFPSLHLPPSNLPPSL